MHEINCFCRFQSYQRVSLLAKCSIQWNELVPSVPRLLHSVNRRPTTSKTVPFHSTWFPRGLDETQPKVPRFHAIYENPSTCYCTSG